MSNRLALGLVSLLPLLSIVACAVAPLEETDSTSADIIGGTADSGDIAVVGILAEDNDGNYGLCTGEIISPTIVLTAAHCVAPAALGFSPTKAIIVVDPDMSAFVKGAGDLSKTLESAGYTFHPQFDAKSGANDIAVIQLASPTTIKPLPFNRSAAAMKSLVGKTGRAIGYGQTINGDATSSFHKRQATLDLSNLTATTFLAKAGNATQCHGDSGGPVIAKVNGVDTIVGIGWETVTRGESCALGVEDTRVDAYADYLAQFLGGAGQSTGGTAPAPASAPTTSSSNSSNVKCCVNNVSYACPTVAACLGGFDINACMQACKTTDCLIGCSKQANAGKGPTSACKKSGTCG